MPATGRRGGARVYPLSGIEANADAPRGELIEWRARAARRMRSRGRAWAFGAVVSSALALACTPPAPKRVVLISIDTLRADHVGAYGAESAHAGGVLTGVVPLRDVAPTILDLLRLEPLPGTERRSLLPRIRDPRETRETDAAYLETLSTEFHWEMSPLLGLRGEDWKYVRAPRPELYDLGADPKELRNLASEARNASASWTRCSRRASQTHGRPCPT